MVISTDSEYEAMYREHYGDLLRFVARRAQPAQVDDIVGETFLAAWRKRAKLPVEVRPWLFATARNAMLNADRGIRRRQALAVRVAEQPQAGHDPARHADARLDLAAAWKQLTGTDQEVLALVAWDGLTDVQAATVLGCSASAFRMRLSRARVRLRGLLHPRAAGAPAVATSPQSPQSPQSSQNSQSPQGAR